MSASVGRLNIPLIPLLAGLAAAILIIVVGLPLGSLVYGSLRDAPPGLSKHFTLEHYKLLDNQFLRQLWTSFYISVGSTAVAFVIGLALAAIMVRTDVRARRIIENAILMPAYMTPFIGAIAWALIFSPQIGYGNKIFRSIGLPTLNIYSRWGIIGVMGIYFAPIIYLYMRPALSRLDRSVEEAGRVFGATPWKTGRKIVLQLMKPAILSALLIVFVQSLGMFAVPSVLGPRAGVTVLPTQIVNLATSDSPDPNGAAVYGVLLTAITLTLLLWNRRAIANRDFTTFSGRGAQPWRKGIGRWSIATTVFCWLYVLLAVVLPLIVIIIVSMQPFVTTNPFKTGFTLQNYHMLFHSAVLSRSIKNSVELAIGTALTTGVMSILIGYILVRTRLRGRGAVDYVANSTLGIPETVFGLAVLWAWVTIPIGVYGTMWILYIAYVAIFLPYSLQITVGAYRQFDNSLEDAARIFGASWLTATRKILVPLLAPALVSGIIIVMYHAVRELSASILLYNSGTEVMSVSIYGLYIQGSYDELCALALVNVVVVLILVVLANTIARRFRGVRMTSR